MCEEERGGLVALGEREFLPRSNLTYAYGLEGQVQFQHDIIEWNRRQFVLGIDNAEQILIVVFCL